MNATQKNETWSLYNTNFLQNADLQDAPQQNASQQNASPQNAI
jgi:hypothetical protein